MFPVDESKKEISLNLIYSNFGTKIIKYENVIPAVIINEKNKNILIPDTKIKANQIVVISSVCPISGCEISISKTGISIIALKKYLKYNFLLLKDNTLETIIIKKGFKISIGWNLGRMGRSNHLLDPFTSIPINKTNTKLAKKIKNKMIENLINVS